MLNLLNKNPREGAMALLQGDRFLSQGDFERAIEFHTKAINLLPDDAEILENAYWSRGLSKMNIGDFTQALEDFNKAINLNDNYLLAYSSRGRCYFNLQKWHKAISDYEKALTLDYDIWHQEATDRLEDEGLLHQNQVRYEIHIGAAIAYNEVFDLTNCLKHLEAAYKINPSDQILDLIKQTLHRVS